MKIKIKISELWEPEMGYIRKRFSETTAQGTTLQTHYMDSKLKRRGNDRFHVLSTWNPRGVFVGYVCQLSR